MQVMQTIINFTQLYRGTGPGYCNPGGRYSTQISPHPSQSFSPSLQLPSFPPSSNNPLQFSTYTAFTHSHSSLRSQYQSFSQVLQPPCSSPTPRILTTASQEQQSQPQPWRSRNISDVEEGVLSPNSESSYELFSCILLFLKITMFCKFNYKF